MTGTWLVTGSSGFLGSNAGLWLQGKATRVGISRTTRSAHLFDREDAIDIRDHSALTRKIRDVRPDVILHTAAISGHETCAQDPEQAFAVNVEASAVISEVAADVGARMIYISTDAVFPGTTGNYAETDAPGPFSYYGETKLAGEQVVRDSGAEALIVRTNFFGWSVPRKRSVVEFFVDSLRAGEEIHGYPDFIVTSIYVRSLLECLWQLNEAGTTGTVHVASSDPLSKYDFGLEVARTFGLDASLIDPIEAIHAAHATSRSRDISLNTDLLASIVGSPPQTQAAGIRQARDEESALRALIREGFE